MRLTALFACELEYMYLIQGEREEQYSYPLYMDILEWRMITRDSVSVPQALDESRMLAQCDPGTLWKELYPGSLWMD